MKRQFDSRANRVRSVVWTIFAGVFAISGAAALSSAESILGLGGNRGQQSTRKTTDPPIMPKGNLGQDLFIAIDHRDTAAVQALLKKGADPNARNGLEFTPLYIAVASHQPEVVQELLKAGADPNAESSYGTALTFAAGTGNVDAAKRLLALKVNPNPIRNDGMNPLMMAAYSGAVPIIDDLLKLNVDVNIKDFNDSTALFYAIRAGNFGAAKRLIDAGADVSIADYEGQTPLMAAAVVGRADMVKLVASKGGDPNAKDSTGRTALVLAAEYGDHPDVIDALLNAGANPKSVDGKGRTAAAIAQARGFSASATRLGRSASNSSSSKTPRQAVLSSLKVIQGSMKKFSEMTACISCHQEGLGRIATGSAKSKGFALDPAVDKVLKARVDGTLDALRQINEAALKSPDAAKQLPLVEINEVSTLDSWLLNGMAAHKEQPSASTSAMAMVLARQQSPAGFWSFSVPRLPMQSSFFTFTALSVRSMSVYGPRANAAEIADRTRKAKAWLLMAKVQNSEDRASRLLGLKWAGASSIERKKSVAEIRADQHSDGGWSQLPGGASDAYATGQALYALRIGGDMATSDPSYQRGVKYLLRTQDDDGSWFVNKRAFPANNYFDSAFPHGQSQYASFNGTCWATLALLEATSAK